jgi:hypothetical protein
MTTYKVKNYRNEKYMDIEANTAKEAAEKLYGRELSEVGSIDHLRVMVREPCGRKAMLFYDLG